MKKIVLSLAYLGFTALHISCSGGDDILNFEPTPDTGEMVSVKVTEYKTNLPAAGVKLSTFTCKNYDVEFGSCLEQVLFSSCTTDNTGTGNCRFPKNNFYKVTLEKPQYWFASYREENNFRYTIVPESWVNIIFTTAADYPETANFSITVIGDNSYKTNYIPASNNSNETLTLFGNQENEINWVLYETSNSSSAVLNSGSFTFDAGKFDNFSYNLEY